MGRTAAIARVLTGDQLECEVVTAGDQRLKLTGSTTDVEPQAEGSEALLSNKALVHNAWAYTKFTYQKVNLSTKDEQERADELAEAHRKVTEWIADLADEHVGITRSAWCSSCFASSDHRKVKRPTGRMPAYLCVHCGSPTLPCASPRCRNMAVRGRGAVRAPRYCAEHRHDIPGFEKSEQKLEVLADYRKFLEYDCVARAGFRAVPELPGVSSALGREGAQASGASCRLRGPQDSW